MEDGIDVGLRADAHVLLAETPHMGLDIGELLQRNKSAMVIEYGLLQPGEGRTHQLLSKRDLLELHLVDTGRRRAQQHSRREECALHDCDQEAVSTGLVEVDNSQYICLWRTVVVSIVVMI